LSKLETFRAAKHSNLFCADGDNSGVDSDSKVASGLDDFNLRRQDWNVGDVHLPELPRRAQPHDLSLGWVK